MRKFLGKLFGLSRPNSFRRNRRRIGGLERLERREVFAADPLPVLMVIADQRDFYYQEYSDTRASLEAAGLNVDVAATTTSPSLPHWNSGQGSASGMVTPNLRLDSVQAADYSAVVFVGGWGSSMYQYAFAGTYQNSLYNGDAGTKAVVNRLIDDFGDQGKHVTAICHGVTVLAWARVDGHSPIEGKLVSVPWLGSPAGTYNGQTYAAGQLMQNVQAIANGATTPARSGAIGNPSTAADDVVVDGKIITAENYESAREFGRVIAREVLAAQPDVDETPPALEIVGGNLIIRGTDLADRIFVLPANGDSDVDGRDFLIWQRSSSPTPQTLPPGGHIKVFAGLGNDTVSIDSRVKVPTEIYGEGGDDLLVGGSGRDVLIGGDGNDRLEGNAGGDRLEGSSGNDYLKGWDGTDRIFGGNGNDIICGGNDNDLVLGESGDDWLWGGDGLDIVIGGMGNDTLTTDTNDLAHAGTTRIDQDEAALLAILQEWSQTRDRERWIDVLSF